MNQNALARVGNHIVKPVFQKLQTERKRSISQD